MNHRENNGAKSIHKRKIPFEALKMFQAEETNRGSANMPRI
jgi:hypothetical protein